MLNGTDQRQRPNYVSFSHYLPYPGIGHAGGEYVARHVEQLQKYCDVSLIVSSDGAPNTDLQPCAGTTVAAAHIVQRPWWGRTIPFRALRRALRMINPMSLGPDVVRAIHRSSEVRRVVRTADVVEFQYTEQSVFIPFVKNLAPEAFTVVIVHDVVSQRISRQVSSAARMLRPLLLFKLARVRNFERRLAAADLVKVFSEKDADLVRQLGIAPERVETISLPLADQDAVRAERSPVPGRILFVGAWSRPENAEAATWIIREVFPSIREARSDAHLVFAGANPSEAMIQLAAQIDGVTVTGFVESLAPCYQSASCVVVPLRQGAGVKFKTVTALLWGIPLVTTSVGAEGVSGASSFGVVADSAAEFATGVALALNGGLEELASEGRAWALRTFGDEIYDQEIRRLAALRRRQSG